jgi:CelD/BcsL family acetyltransferase involved in cellulose biosynthesis
MGEEVTAHPGIEPVASDWDELARATGASPFLRPGWLRAWWDGFGSGQLTVFAARRRHRLVGVLPVVRRRNVVTSPTNWHTPAYGPVAVDEAAAAALVRALLATGPRRVTLEFLPGDDVESATFDGAYRRSDRVVLRSPYVPIEQGWDGYRAGLSKNLRSGLRRTRRRLEERGPVSFDFWDGGDDLELRLDEGFRLEGSGWKERDGTAIRSSEATARFYGDVGRWASASGLLRLSFLRLGDRPIAFDMGIESGGVHYALKGGYDPEFRQLGAGRLLMEEVLRRCFERGLSSYEFLGGEDSYKLRWTEHRRELVTTQLFAPTLSGAVEQQLEAGRDAARRVIRAIRNPSEDLAAIGGLDCLEALAGVPIGV